MKSCIVIYNSLSISFEYCAYSLGMSSEQMKSNFWFADCPSSSQASGKIQNNLGCTSFWVQQKDLDEVALMQLKNMHSSFESFDSNEFYWQNFVENWCFTHNMLPKMHQWGGGQTHRPIADTLLYSTTKECGTSPKRTHHFYWQAVWEQTCQTQLILADLSIHSASLPHPSCWIAFQFLSFQKVRFYW